MRETDWGNDVMLRLGPAGTGWSGKEEEKMFDKDKKFWMLQLFADDEGNNPEQKDPDGKPKGGGNEDDPKPPTFDEFLGQGKNKAEFDRRVNKAIETAVKNAREQWELETNDKLSEAEKLARMTKEQKAEYRAQQMEKEIAALKREKTMAEMAKIARKMLADEDINLPDDLLAHLISEDAEKTKAAVEGFCELFKDAVQEQVKNALKGGSPKKGDENTVTKEQILDIKDPIERQRLIAENIKLFS